MSAQGTARVAFTVETDGTVSDVHISQSSGNPQLDWASVACVQHEHYTPAKRAGIPVRVEWSTTVHFDRSMVYARDDYVDTSRPAADGPPHSCMEYYPAEAQYERAQGTNMVSFVIGTDGSVRDPKITQSSGNPLLDSATIECVQHWHYIPARRDGAAVETPWSATVQYALR